MPRCVPQQENLTLHQLLKTSQSNNPQIAQRYGNDWMLYWSLPMLASSNAGVFCFWGIYKFILKLMLRFRLVWVVKHHPYEY